jgi:hypothetical protein
VVLVFGPFTHLFIGFFGAGSLVPVLVVNVLTQWGALAILVWICARVFLEGRQSGFVELVLTTPKGADRLVKTHWNAIWRVLRIPLLLALLLTVAYSLLATVSRTPDFYWLIYIMYPVVSILEIIAVCWLGMLFGVRARNALGTIFSTLVCIQLLPWVLSLLVRFLSFGSFHLTLWVVQTSIVGACYLFFWRWARRRLLFHFREEISERRSYTAGMTDSLRSLIALIRRVRHWS